MANIEVFPLRSYFEDNEEAVNECTKRFLDSLQKNSTDRFNIIHTLSELDDGDLGVFLLESGNVETRFRDFSKVLKSPFIFLVTGYGDSLKAALEIISYLHNTGKEGILIYGEAEEINRKLNSIICEKIYRTSEQGFRLGIIGRVNDSHIASEVDYYRAKSIFNVELVDLTLQELIFDYTGITAHMEPGRVAVFYDKNELNKAYRLYKAMKQVLKEHRLNGMALNNRDISGSIHTSASLAVSLLEERGIIALEDTDIPDLLASLIVRYVINEPSMQVTPFAYNLKNNTVSFSSDTLPLSMCESYSFEHNFSLYNGVAIKGILPRRRVTALRISSDLRHYFIAEGKIVGNLNLKDHERTQFTIQFDNDIGEAISNPLGSSLVIADDNKEERLKKYLDDKGLKEIY